jgi:hypothetical protein
MKLFSKDDGAKVGMGTLLTALIVVVVGLALVPTIQNSANSSVAALGATSAGGQLAALVPLFFVLIVIAGVVVYVVFTD